MFITILIITMLSIAGSAAFFTMFGLAQMFTSSFWPVVIAGGVIEAGKLVVASYTYRYWEHIKWYFKPLYIGMVLGAMLFTSLGIFGYLSASYQQDVLPLDEINAKVEILDQRATTLEGLKEEALIQMNRLQDDKSKEIAALPPKFATKKKEVAERYQAMIDKAISDVDAYNLKIRTLLDQKQELKISVIKQETKSGPIIFIAQAVGVAVDDAVKWLILLIVIIFDPMAVLLAIAANQALIERMAHKRRRVDDRVHVLEEALETAETPSEATVEAVEEVLPENMTIGQLEEMVESMSGKRLSRMENQQKQMLEQMIAKKTLTEKIRNPDNG